MLLDGVRVVLVNTRFPENVGMAVRACANMGCSELTLVTPEMWIPEKAAPLATAKGAPLLSRVKVVSSLAEAIGDCHLILATTARTGGWRKALQNPGEAACDVARSLSGGERVAIVGPTGCGKTTFINLLMRFYDPDGGEILLDGVNTQKMNRGELRRSVGMVLQDTWLKAGTIRENIAMGKPDATDEEIIAAAKASHAHSFIKRLPDGYNTVISESGGQLSQGQKQLLCIARVMLCLPPMLILDEATSSIDTRTEVRIQAAFARMMQGRTSFIVAHRLSTIREADVILVMKDGRIVEQGDHDTLLAQGGFYAKLYNSQFEGVET